MSVDVPQCIRNRQSRVLLEATSTSPRVGSDCAILTFRTCMLNQKGGASTRIKKHSIMQLRLYGVLATSQIDASRSMNNIESVRHISAAV